MMDQRDINIASDWETSPEELAQLARDALKEGATYYAEEVVFSIAENPNAPSGLLAHLGLSSNWMVRSHVAGNPNASQDTLRALSKDPDGNVRYWVACNPKTPVDVLIGFLDDPSSSIPKRVLLNPSLPIWCRVSQSMEVL